MYEYIGNMHIHSAYSDGSLAINEIAKAAAQAGLNFIIVTDHGNLDGYINNEEGYYNKVLVIIGLEANMVKNHYLCLDVKVPIASHDDNPQKVINDVNKQKGIGIIAHPFDKGSPLDNGSISFKWLDWEVSDFQGIEIWNYTSQWKGKISNRLKALLFVIYPHLALSGPCPLALKKLDLYQKQGNHVIAAGGSDAHGKILKLGFISLALSDYYYLFRCINIHLLTGNPLTGNHDLDKQKIYTALRKGCFWTAYDYFFNSRGFRYVIKSRDQSLQMGDTVPYSKDVAAEIITPHPSKVKFSGASISFSTKTAAAPFDIASSAKRCPSVLKPGIHTKMQPGVTFLESY
jgi:hypothetical protein